LTEILPHYEEQDTGTGAPLSPKFKTLNTQAPKINTKFPESRPSLPLLRLPQVEEHITAKFMIMKDPTKKLDSDLDLFSPKNSVLSSRQSAGLEQKKGSMGSRHISETLITTPRLKSSIGGTFPTLTL